MLEDLKQDVLEANRQLETSGLVKLTWGNVSGIDRDQGLVVIKPSGVPYADLRTEHLVVLDLDGNPVESELNPSSDTPTHLRLYQEWPEIKGITHTHSEHATMFCQAVREIPCLGTTHADHFFGTIPVARALTKEELDEGYELNTGNVIIERFQDLNPMEMPAVLLAHHAPFTWGRSPMDSLKNSIALESVARMALGAFQLNPELTAMPEHILNKHYERKHGPDAYYGQKHK
ncbi:MAG: L-ribulose-5-phosphate 4-epimerase AraD [Verrucomicrobiota bacterium]